MPKTYCLVSNSKFEHSLATGSCWIWFPSCLTWVVTLPTLVMAETSTIHHKVNLGTLQGENTGWPEGLLYQSPAVDGFCTISKVSGVDSFKQVQFPDQVRQKTIWWTLPRQLMVCLWFYQKDSRQIATLRSCGQFRISCFHIKSNCFDQYSEAGHFSCYFHKLLIMRERLVLSDFQVCWYLTT